MAWKIRFIENDREGSKLWKLVKSLHGDPNQAAPRVLKIERGGGGGGGLLSGKKAVDHFIAQYQQVNDIVIDPERERAVHEKIR